MAVIYIEGNPRSKEERERLVQEAFDRFMQLPPLDQRRFLRRYGFTEAEIDRALKDPTILRWEIRPGGSSHS